MKSSDKPIRDRLAAQHENIVTILTVDNRKIVGEQYNDEKLAITLLIVGTWIIAYHFW